MTMQIDHNRPLAHFNSFAVSAYADQLFVLTCTDQLAELIPVMKKHRRCLTLGEGSNVLFRNNFPGLVIINQLKGAHMLRDTNHSVLVEAGAGENWHGFVCWCIDNGYHGLENLSLIPGTVGASPIQNIGAYGVEVEKYIESLTAVDLATNTIIRLNNRDCHFAYRDSIFRQKPDQYLIISVRFKLSKSFTPMLAYSGIKEKLLESNINPRTVTAKQVSSTICTLRRQKLPDPEVIGNAGSFFKNPVITAKQYLLLRNTHAGMPMYAMPNDTCKIPAAWLIEQCGYKGYRLGDAGVYEHHALVLVNHGQATGEQVWQLARTIQSAVEKMFGIILAPEPRIL